MDRALRTQTTNLNFQFYKHCAQFCLFQVWILPCTMNQAILLWVGSPAIPWNCGSLQHTSQCYQQTTLFTEKGTTKVR